MRIRNIFCKFRNPRRYGIRMLLIVALFLSVLTTAVVINGFTGVMGWQNGLAQTTHQLQAITALRETQIDIWLDDAERELALISTDRNILLLVRNILTNLEDTGAGTQAIQLQTQLQKIRRQTGQFTALFLLDLQGKVLVSTDDNLIGVTYDSVPSLQVKLEEACVMPFRPSLEAKISTLFLQPVFDEGVPIAILGGHTNLERLNTIMDSLAGLGDTGETYLVDRDYILLTESRFDGYQVGETIIQTKGTESAFETHEMEDVAHPLMYNSYRGTPVIGVYKWLPQLDVALMAEQDQAEIFGPTQSILLLNGFVTFLVALLVTLSGFWLIETNVARRLIRLSHTAQTIASGNLALLAAVDRDDEIGAVAQSFNDMTAQLRYMIAQTQEYARQVQQIIDTVPESVLLLSADRQIILANPVAEKDLIALADSQLGDTLDHLGNRLLDDLLTSPPKGLWHEVEIDGDSPRKFEVIARPIETGPTQGGWVLVIRDVTHEREIQKHVQQQNRLAAVGQLAAGIAHDFNNIMAIIILYTQIVQKVANLPPKAQERLRTISEQAHRATDLIEQILDFSRRSVMDRQPLDLLPFVKEQVKLLERTLRENIKIDLTYEPGEYVVSADPTRIQQAITNLAVNAQDAMPEGGKLSIEIAKIWVEARASPLLEMEPGEWVQISASDSGAGIASNVLPHIFEPFFTTKAPKGTGLGLAQVYGIVKQHEGHVDVTTQLGKGTTFTLYLPSLSARPVEGPITQTQPLVEGQGEMILLVEDNPATREALKDSLELLGYRVLTAENGQKALGVWEQYNSSDEIAMVLSDVVMPEMGGIALFHALRQRDSSVKIVLLTGHLLENRLDGELEDLKAQGLTGWLHKPASLEQLAQVITQTLDEK